jgi:hypothetical protein
VIARQSFIYLSELLLMYRLKPAKGANGSPGNMHRLMEALFRKGHAEWGNTLVERDQRSVFCEAAFFQTVKERLTALCLSIEDMLCKTSKNQRDQYSPIQLKAQQCAAEVPEEMSLFEVIRVLPLPLQNLVDDADLTKLMLRVMHSLNERYMLLRACGLNPEDWLQHEELSMGKLEDMRQLHKTAKETAGGEGCERDISLYQRCFYTLLAGKKTFAGFASFDAFAHSEVGEIFLQSFALVSPKELIELIADDEDEYENDPRSSVEKLMASNSAPFQKDLVMRYFFMESLAGGQPLCGDERIKGILDDSEFQQLVANDPLYADLDKPKLARKIYQRAERIIKARRKK